MLENGARGATQQVTASILGTTSLDAVGQDQGWAGLLAALKGQSAADGVTLQSADSLWRQKGLPMQPTFMADLGSYLGAGVWQTDFANDLAQAEAAINGWVAQRTNRKITRLFGPGQLDHTTVLVLANAVHFNAAWQTPFDRPSRRSDRFSRPPAGRPP